MSTQKKKKPGSKPWSRTFYRTSRPKKLYEKRPYELSTYIEETPIPLRAKHVHIVDILVFHVYIEIMAGTEFDQGKAVWSYIPSEWGLLSKGVDKISVRVNTNMTRYVQFQVHTSNVEPPKAVHKKDLPILHTPLIRNCLQNDRESLVIFLDCLTPSLPKWAGENILFDNTGIHMQDNHNDKYYINFENQTLTYRGAVMDLNKHPFLLREPLQTEAYLNIIENIPHPGATLFRIAGIWRVSCELNDSCVKCRYRSSAFLCNRNGGLTLTDMEENRVEYPE